MRRARRLEDVLRENREFLRQLAARLCRGAFDPDDLLQDVLERTVRHFPTLAPDLDHRMWMARVMRNLFIDRVRRRKTAPASVEIDEAPPALPPDEPAWWEGLDAADIQERLRAVPEELRRAFELFALEGCSYQEIADRLGVPKATVGTRILRARRRIKQLFLEDRGQELGDD